MKHLLSLILLAVLSTGCTDKHPADMPKLFPCTITLLDKNAVPLEGAVVGVLPPTGRWAGIGTTDADGTVVIRTHATYNGLPAGPYKVTVSKYDENEKSLLDAAFIAEETTPLECVVEEKPNEFRFEVW